MNTVVMPFNTSSEFYTNVYQFFLKHFPEVLDYFKLSPQYFDFSTFHKKYLTSDYVQDLSANPSSNVENKSIARLKGDIINIIMKYLTFETLFNKMKELYGINEAISLTRQLLDGSLYLHDASAGIIGYCLGVDFSRLLEEGMPYGQLYSLPPKKPKTFINQVKEAIIELSNEFAGAIAFPTLLILYSYIYCKTYGIDCIINEKEVIDDFQNLVHTINKEMRNGIESPFTNISFFDKYILDEILTYVFPHLVNQLKNKEKFLDKIQQIQKIVLEFLCKGDPVTKAPYRFPVITVNFIKDKETNEILDKDFLELVSQNNTKGQVNIYISSDARKFSMCCFHPSQKVLVKTDNGIELVKIGDLIERSQAKKRNLRVYHNGSWIKANPVKVKYEKKWYKIKTSNNKEIIVTDNHIHPTLQGDKTTKELTTNDYLLFTTIPLQQNFDNDNKFKNYDYLDGFIIGLVLENGIFDETTNDISFSLNSEKFDIIKIIIENKFKKFAPNTDIITEYSKNNNDILIKINNEALKEFITTFVNKSDNFEKFIILENILKTSYEFRLGLLSALWLINNKQYKIYTTSKQIIESLEIIFTSLGIPTKIDILNKTDKIDIITNKKQNKDQLVYCIEYYSPSSKSFSDLQIIFNNIYFKIISIEEIKNIEGIAYCFEVIDEKPYFTLPNGIITHNCRYQPDISDIKFDSFGNGGINIGSIKVVTINLNRIALETLRELELNKIYEDSEKSDKEIFLGILKDRMLEAKQILDGFRECLRDNIKKGIYRFFKLGWFDLDKHFYSTIGFIGLYEAIQTLGYNITDNFTLEILQTMDNIIKEFNKDSKWKYNLEQVPGESLAGLFPKLDKYFYGEKLVPYILYANQFIPLYIRHSILDKIAIEGKFYQYLSGGGITHINILSEMKPEEVKELIQMCAEKGLEHFALNPVYSICKNNHYILGKYDKCYICKEQIIDNMTRVVGFFTRVSAWSKERRIWEFNKRHWNLIKNNQL